MIEIIYGLGGYCADCNSSHDHPLNNIISTRPPTEEEIINKKLEMQNECIRLLSETDYKVIKAVELGQPLDQHYVLYRQALRDMYNDLSTSNEPWTFIYPTLEQFQQF